MDLNGLLRMAGRLLLRKVMGRAMGKGIDMAFGAEKPKDAMTREERQRHRAAKDQGKRLRQSMRIGRKLW